MAEQLEFGLMAFPWSAAATRRLASRVEALGFSWFGFADSPVLYQESYLYQFEVLHVIICLWVGLVVIHVMLRHPLIIGNLLVTLNEIGGGRTVGTLVSGNSGVRGVGLRSLIVAELGEAIEAIRGYWVGCGGKFGASVILVIGIMRSGCLLLVVVDGYAVAMFVGQRVDGFFYGGTMERMVLVRRFEVGCTCSGQMVWVGSVVLFGCIVGEVFDDMGVFVVVMVNCAFCGDFNECVVLELLYDDV